MQHDDGPADMDELLRRGEQSVPATSSALGQVAGLSGLLAVFSGAVSVLAAGVVVAGGVVVIVVGMLIAVPFLLF
ncbi:hypothetical protein [Curtobacterium sp. 9128]|uniref:hypothetical protein n=1 Tax=Curtobacterium sp. 9128 TaxID=1793722 RepID=UPI0011A4C9A8|nr:hypothetical protein [Curtobacterium sp. 9128]